MQWALPAGRWTIFGNCGSCGEPEVPAHRRRSTYSESEHLSGELQKSACSDVLSGCPISSEQLCSSIGAVCRCAWDAEFSIDRCKPVSVDGGAKFSELRSTVFAVPRPDGSRIWTAKLREWERQRDNERCVANL